MEAARPAGESGQREFWTRERAADPLRKVSRLLGFSAVRSASGLTVSRDDGTRGSFCPVMSRKPAVLAVPGTLNGSVSAPSADSGALGQWGGVCVCGFTAPPEEGWGSLWGEGSPWPHLPAEEEDEGGTATPPRRWPLGTRG